MRGERREEREKRGEKREERGERGERRERRENREEKEKGEKEEKGMTLDLPVQSGFASAVSLSLHVRVTCLHSGSWLLSGVIRPPPRLAYKIFPIRDHIIISVAEHISSY